MPFEIVKLALSLTTLSDPISGEYACIIVTRPRGPAPSAPPPFPIVFSASSRGVVLRMETAWAAAALFAMGLWVHQGSLGSLVFALGSLGSSRVVGFAGVRPGSRWIHPGSLGSLGFALGVVGFI